MLKRLFSDIQDDDRKQVDKLFDALFSGVWDNDDDLVGSPPRARLNKTKTGQRSFQSVLEELELDADSSPASTTASTHSSSSSSETSSHGGVDADETSTPEQTPDEAVASSLPAQDLQFGPALFSDDIKNGTTTPPRSIVSEQNSLEAMLDSMPEPRSPVCEDAFRSMPNTICEAMASSTTVGKSSSSAAAVDAMASCITVGTTSSAAFTEAQLEDLIDPLLPEPAEWWYSYEFWDNVNWHLRDVRDADWCILDFFDDAPRSWTKALNAATSFINDNVVDSQREFKIGITECCRIRWENDIFGWKWEGMEIMVVLYAAPNSNKHVMYSTGAFEKELIREFARVEGCMNCRGTGGETPSMGSPHFAYVVVRKKK